MPQIESIGYALSSLWGNKRISPRFLGAKRTNSSILVFEHDAIPTATYTHDFFHARHTLRYLILGIQLIHKTHRLTGNTAGEHLVLSRLLSRGVLAAQAPRGARKADILVNFLDGGTPALIQVKSRQSGGDGGWHMAEKHETQVD